MLLLLLLLFHPGSHLCIFLSEHTHDTCGNFVVDDCFVVFVVYDVNAKFLFIGRKNWEGMSGCLGGKRERMRGGIKEGRKARDI